MTMVRASTTRYVPSSTGWPLQSSEPNSRFFVKKWECFRGTAPLQGFAGSAICSGLETPGMKPFPATDSRTNFLRPAFVSAVASSVQVVVLAHVQTSDDCAAAPFDTSARSVPPPLWALPAAR